MKAINRILSILLGIFIFLCLTSYIPKFNYTKEDFLYFLWTWVNGVFAGTIAINYSTQFYKWFNSHLKPEEDEK